MSRRYPVCDRCGIEINPNKYDDGDRAYISRGETLCRECFLKDADEYIHLNTDDFAELVGVMVRGTE